jgi:pimeloyl-ACP methyl ester carboxylesterase
MKLHALVVLLLLAQTACAPFVENGSRCSTSEAHISCTYHTDDVWTGLANIHARRVHWEVPIGTPPVDGWPVVIFFQGSFWRAEWTFSGRAIEPFGSYEQAATVRDLLDAGYAVIAPETKLRGFSFWDSNVVGFSVFWELAEDDFFFRSVLEEIERDRFGSLDERNVFVAGVSSGGYMASRIAITYPESVRAATIVSASYAWCWGLVCVPGPIDDDHPPTLFLHGGRDLVVPASTSQSYADALDAAGIANRVVIDNDTGHGWIPGSSAEVLGWFTAALDDGSD